MKLKDKLARLHRSAAGVSTMGDQFKGATVADVKADVDAARAGKTVRLTLRDIGDEPVRVRRTAAVA